MQQPSVAPTAAAGAGAHSKPPPRRKKRAPAIVQEQHQARIGRSASASTAVPFRSGELLEAKYPTAAAVPGRGAAGVQQHLPPRSPLKTAKVCVPSLEDALDDVQVRFVLNLPDAELSSADRLFFQLEQAWWFYEDHIADAHKHLPHFKLKEFAKLLFQHCEALRPLSGKYLELFEYFRSWKGTIPTAGCILLNAAMTDVVLVKCWKGNSRGLPKGKINQDESAFDAAMREVQEETGYDARGGAREKDFLTVYLNGQQTTMYVVTGVDETYPFEPQVRKEISAIEWFPLDALPKGSYGVEPFVPRLRRWMAKSKGVRAPKIASTPEARTQSLLRARKARATSPDVSLAVAAAVSISKSQPSSPTGTGTASSNGNASSKKQGRKGSRAVTSGGSKAHMGSHSAGGENVRACSAPSRRGGGGGGGGGQHPKAKGYDLKNHDTFGGGGCGIDGAPGGGGGGGAEGWDFEAMLAANERLTGRTFVYDGNPHEFGDPAHAARVSAPAGAVEARESAATARNDGDGRSGQLKQRKSSKGGGAKNRSRSVGKDREGAKENAKGNANACVVVGGTTDPNAAAATCNGGDGGGGSLAAATGVRAPAMGSGGVCTEGTGGSPAAVSMWGDAAVAATSSGGAGAGVFGDFKFDLRDIMNAAVPQG